MSLYPAILTDSTQEVQAYLDVCQALPMVETVQIDVIDGQFADNLTVTPSDLLDMEWGKLSCDFHLMVDEPMDTVFELVEVKDVLPIRAVIGQVEKMSHQGEFLAEVKKYQWKAGLSLDIFTPVQEITAEAWATVHIVQLMAIEAGAQGQEFKSQVLAKVDEVRQLARAQSHSIEVVVDGGVDIETIKQLSKHGIHHVAVGSALWTSRNLPETARTLASYTE